MQIEITQFQDSVFLMDYIMMKLSPEGRVLACVAPVCMG